MTYTPTPPHSPYLLPDGPVAIQFSGGRTSGYLLHQILDAHGGILPKNALCLFQNTGREMPETLDFVEDVGRRWGVEIHWLEFDADTQWRRVGPGTNRPASRNGEPFEALIRKRQYLPNQQMRFCTSELKVRPAIRYLRDWIGWDRWVSVVGIRADEAHRAKPDRESRQTCIWPLIEGSVTKRDVKAFWDAQPFDLRLPNINGKTPLGNCDGCFLKSERNRAYLARYFPERAQWWADMESLFVSSADGDADRFDKRTRWRSLIEQAQVQPDWIHDLEEGASPFCETNFGGCHD